MFTAQRQDLPSKPRQEFHPVVTEAGRNSDVFFSHDVGVEVGARVVGFGVGFGVGLTVGVAVGNFVGAVVITGKLFSHSNSASLSKKPMRRVKS